MQAGTQADILVLAFIHGLLPTGHAGMLLWNETSLRCGQRDGKNQTHRSGTSASLGVVSGQLVES